MVKTLIALRHGCDKEFGVGFREMKKAIAIIILGLSLVLLNSCGMDYEKYRNQNPQFPHYAEACPASNPNVEGGCGLAAGHTQEQANTGALEVCGRKFNDCVIVKETNRNVYQQSLINKQKVSLASMTDDAKSTCKGLGFTEGTDKFADCSLKLYSQSIELAAKNNQQVQNMSGGVMTIYDPVRDSNALIRQGQRMISGACTLGVNC